MNNMGFGRVGGRLILNPCWFSLNNSEIVKIVTLGFCSMRSHFIYFIRNTRAKFGIVYSSQSPNIGQKPYGGISDFWIFGQSPIKENCRNSRTSDDIDVELEPETKLDKERKHRQNVWERRHVGKVSRPYQFFNLWPIWRNPEAGFRTHSL